MSPLDALPARALPQSRRPGGIVYHSYVFLCFAIYIMILCIVFVSLYCISYIFIDII